MSDDLTPSGAFLGLDLGEKRIGVAVSDHLGMISSPVSIVPVDARTVDALAKLAREHNAVLIVAGLPRTLSGREGPQAARVRLFAEEIAQQIGLPLAFWDERLTTAMANRSLKAAGKSERTMRGKKDAIAAAIMLQGYLDAGVNRKYF